ncbi:MAG: hypothetical protein AB8B71_11300 [Paracoccaceae bacterium]
MDQTHQFYKPHPVRPNQTPANGQRHGRLFQLLKHQHQVAQAQGIPDISDMDGKDCDLDAVRRLALASFSQPSYEVE